MINARTEQILNNKLKWCLDALAIPVRRTKVPDMHNAFIAVFGSMQEISAATPLAVAEKREPQQE